MDVEIKALILRKLHNGFYICCPWGGLVTKKSVLLPWAQEARMGIGKYNIAFLLWRMV